MKIAITGGTGFVGRHLARALVEKGHEVVLIARGRDRRDQTGSKLQGARLVATSVDDQDGLMAAFAGCDGVAHCAGINREIGTQTYARIHVEGTRKVVHAAKVAGVNKIVLLSFLRARPDCGSGYHESKFAAEEIVRNSGLDYTILKAGVIYGHGDHMLDHLSHALHTFPLFALVGMKDRPMRPTAVEDVARIIRASLIEGRLSRQTVAVVGPEEITLREAVHRVARAVRRRVCIFGSPVIFSYLLAWLFERCMTIPLISIAQVRILSEGIVESASTCTALPDDLAPALSFSDEQIKKGLPESKPFGLRDCRWKLHRLCCR